MKRRVFLKTVGGAAGAAALGVPEIFLAAEPAPKAGELPRRPLGRTGMEVSVVGFPGLVLTKHDQEKGTAALHSAFDRGVNLFDVAPAYGDGEAEAELKQMAANRESLFLVEERQVALNLREWTPVYPDSPYEGGSAMG
jgi:hypothetical protein